MKWNSENFLKTFLKLDNNTPFHDTFNRVFSAINPKQFEYYFISWVKKLVKLSNKEVVAVDGKTLRWAKSNGSRSLYHIVSVRVSE